MTGEAIVGTISGINESISPMPVTNLTNPRAVTCVGIIITISIKVEMNFFALNSYACMAYAVIVEKYTHSTALQAATKRLLNIPLMTGSVSCKSEFQLSSRCVLGIAVNPDWSSPFDLVALIIIT